MSTFPLTWRESVAFKAVNVIAYVLFASSNTYAAMTGMYIAGNVDTYIPPAAWWYGIWHILNVLFLGLIVYQFWPGTAQLTQYSLGWRFPTALVLHALCTLLYTQKNSTPIYCVALITFCMVTILVKRLHENLRTNAEPLNWADVFFVFLPVSFYHGATFVTFFAFLAVSIDAILFGMAISDCISSSRAMHSIVYTEEFTGHLYRCVLHVQPGDNSGKSAL